MFAFAPVLREDFCVDGLFAGVLGAARVGWLEPVVWPWEGDAVDGGTADGAGVRLGGIFGCEVVCCPTVCLVSVVDD